MTKIAFQGVLGAYSEAAIMALYPSAKPVPCTTFVDAFAAVRFGTADLAMIPVENLIAGRVADVHTLLPASGLKIIGEHFQPIIHHLLAIPGTKLGEIRKVISHVQGLSQCRRFLEANKIQAEIFADTAGAAQEVAKLKDKSIAAIASMKAGQVYGLESLAQNIADVPKNVTRFLVLAQKENMPKREIPCLTTLVYTVRSVPAALYKTLGGFATNGVNLTRIESYLAEGNFMSATFSIDVEGHPESEAMKTAVDELKFFAHNVQFLGTYPKAESRI